MLFPNLCTEFTIYSTGIIDSPYSDEWKRQRNIALNILRNLGWGKCVIQEGIKAECQVLIQSLRKTSNKPFDPSHVIGVSVANIICSLLFGKHYDHDDKEFEELLNAVADLLKNFAGGTDAVFIPILQFSSTFKQGMKNLHKAGNKLITFYKRKIDDGKQKLSNGEEPSDFVTQYLVEVGKIVDNGSERGRGKIQEDWLIQVISDFFLAGAETTATTMKWAIVYMAMFPEIQHKVHAEINSVFGKATREFNLSDRDSLPYTDATISEIQRMASIVPIGIPHATLGNTEIGGYKIAKGTQVIYNLLIYSSAIQFNSNPLYFCRIINQYMGANSNYTLLYNDKGLNKSVINNTIYAV